MKLRPDWLEPDLCQTSIDLLRDRCLEVLPAFGLTATAFPDHPNFPADLQYARSETLDVLFFGNFLRRFLETGNWPLGQYRLWVLSAPAREVLVRACGIPHEKIGVIPRYALFPANQSEHPLPDLSREPAHLVFGGRLSPVKNIEFLLRTVSSLQTDYGRPVTLTCYGSFDDDYHVDFGRRALQSHEKTIHELLEQLPWRTRPTLIGKLPAGKWLEDAGSDAVLVNLSTFLMEDYDVSLAQAQALGLPAIVSDWGGHQDAAGSNVLKVPVPEIGWSHEPAPVQELKAKHLAALLVRGSQLLRPLAQGNKSNRPVLPETITTGELDSIRRSFLAKHGAETHVHYRENPETFADTESGRRLFRVYRGIFAGDPKQVDHVVITNDLHPSDLPECRGIEQACLRAVQLAREKGLEVSFIPVDQLDEHASRKRLLLARNVIMPFLERGLLPFIKSWLSADPDSTLHILHDPAVPKALIEETKQLLRTRDQLSTIERAFF